MGGISYINNGLETLGWTLYDTTERGSSIRLAKLLTVYDVYDKEEDVSRAFRKKFATDGQLTMPELTEAHVARPDHVTRTVF